MMVSYSRCCDANHSMTAHILARGMALLLPQRCPLPCLTPSTFFPCPFPCLTYCCHISHITLQAVTRLASDRVAPRPLQLAEARAPVLVLVAREVVPPSHRPLPYSAVLPSWRAWRHLHLSLRSPLASWVAKTCAACMALQLA